MGGCTREVWQLIDQCPISRRGLADGVINASALADRLIEQHGIDASRAAVISAIRRYPIGEQGYEGVASLLSKADITTHSNIVAITWQQGPPTDDLQRLFDASVFGSTANLRLLKGPGTITAILVGARADALLNVLPSERIIDTVRGLSEINIEMSSIGYRTPGVLAAIADILAARAINVEIIISHAPGLSLFVKEAELVRAHEAILSITKQKL